MTLQPIWSYVRVREKTVTAREVSITCRRLTNPGLHCKPSGKETMLCRVPVVCSHAIPIRSLETLHLTNSNSAFAQQPNQNLSQKLGSVLQKAKPVHVKDECILQASTHYWTKTHFKALLPKTLGVDPFFVMQMHSEQIPPQIRRNTVSVHQTWQ